MTNLPYPGWNAVYGEVLTAAKISQLGTNDDALAAGTGINDNAIAMGKLATMTRKAPMYISGGSALPNLQQMVDGVVNTVAFYGLIPDDYVSGNVAIKYLLRAGGNGTAKMTSATYRIRPGSALDIVQSAQDISQALTGNVFEGSSTVPSSHVQANDVLRIDINRNGADSGDTLAASVDVDTCWIEYLGRA